MKVMTRRIRWTLPLLVLLAIPLGGAAVYTPTPTCALATSWAAAHAKVLPLTNEDIARFPVVYQRAMIKEMSADQRVAVLTNHLQSFVQPADSLTPLQGATLKGLTHPLTDEQKQFIVAVMAALPELLALPVPTGEVFVHGARLKAEASRLFHSPDISLIFNRIGPVSTGDKSGFSMAKLNQASMWIGEAALSKLAEKMFGKVRASCTCDGQNCDENSYCGQTQPPCYGGDCCIIWYCACTGKCQAM